MGKDRSVWEVAEGIATTFICAAVTARARMLEHASPLVRLLGQRDALHHEASLLERELAVFRSQRERKPAHQRPHYSPAERTQILEVMKLRGWSAKEAGARFVVHPNTIRNWQRAVRDKLRAEQLLGGPPWNRLHDGVRRLIHEIREAFPEPEFGTRTIARHILRAGIRVSRTSIRRVLLEGPPGPAKQHAPVRVTKAPAHVRHPTKPNQVWHLDMTEIGILWKKIEVAAIVDGSSRKILAMKAFGRRPTSDDLSKLVESSIESGGVSPRFLVTDHGCQFRSRFHASIESLCVTHVRCQVRTWQLNAKVERVFKDVKPWVRRSAMPVSTQAIQSRLDAYAEWHNRYRPHMAHGTLTPVEAEQFAPTPETVTSRQRGGVEPRIKMHRRCVKGDPRLAYPVIRVSGHRLDAAQGSAQTPGPPEWWCLERSGLRDAAISDSKPELTAGRSALLFLLLHPSLVHYSRTMKLLPLINLGPEILRHALAGTLASSVTLEDLLEAAKHLDWTHQARSLGLDRVAVAA